MTPCDAIRGASKFVLFFAIAMPGRVFADGPGVYGRGGEIVLALEGIRLDAAGESWRDILPADAQRMEVGPEGSSLELVRWPAHSVAPAQVRAHYWTGVVLKGQLTVTIAGSLSEHVLSAPSYLMMPAGVTHAVRCSGRVDCMLLLFQFGPHNSVSLKSLADGESTGEPGGLPPYFQGLADPVWSRLRPSVWKGSLGGPAWARLGVGASDAALWKIASGARIAGCVGAGSKHSSGIVLDGTLSWVPATDGSHRLQGTYYHVPRTWTCICSSIEDCQIIAH